MKFFPHRFHKIHLFLFLGFALAFSSLTFYAVMHMSPGDWNDWRGNHPYVATLLTITGPFTAVVLKPYDPYCWHSAWMMLPFCGSFLLFAAVGQLIALPFQRGARFLRLTLWAFALFIWFAGGAVNLLNTLE